MVLLLSTVQKEYMLVKPARDAAAKAKMEAESLSAAECPLHDDNEWNIRYSLCSTKYFIKTAICY